jgi:hypothetical protein
MLLLIRAGVCAPVAAPDNKLAHLQKCCFCFFSAAAAAAAVSLLFALLLCLVLLQLVVQACSHLILQAPSSMVAARGAALASAPARENSSQTTVKH